MKIKEIGLVNSLRMNYHYFGEGTEKYTIFILTLIKKEKKHQNFYDSGGFFVRRNINCLFFRRKFLFFIH